MTRSPADMDAPLFFIATPTRNNLDKLKRCVGSVRNEARQVSVQHFVQDARSTDGTPEWLEAQQDLRFRSERDDGMYDAINRAWSKGQGAYYSWINSDEQYLPGTLRRVHEAFERHPEVDAITGDYIVVDGEGHPIAARRDIGVHESMIAAGLMNVATCATFFRRRLLDEGLLHLDTRYRYAADMDLVLRLTQRGVRWLRLPQYLALFTFDGSNLSCSPKMLEETDDIVRRAGRGWLSRKLAKAQRVGLRLAQGCFQPRDVELHYVMDETGRSVPRSGRRVSAFYRQR